ncbi:hypothetical protein ROA7450_01223 [Roseovarius albus]|uniref:Uncharacterized protein n=1 Tax=Roseovarius albus TaxID=1247867 RepID=A0A1X6YRS9_9RHOB|nr:hypothetical protein [Roseovarius albus]SLN29008.1 hypothetical protein ROA7450_01223 [Roseovarius albus]
MTDVLQILGFTPGRILRVFGMRRSGNHAIINWLQRNAPGDSVFLNNCRRKASVLETFQGCEVNGERHIHKPEDGQPIAEHVSDGAVLLLSYEDFAPVGREDLMDLVSAEFNADDVSHEIVIYRNFTNWSASLLKKLQGNPSHTPLGRLRIMMGALEQYKHMLTLVEEPRGHNMQAIHYDGWCGSAEYRVATLESLELENCDDDLGRVQKYGGGSSFQPNAKTAEELDVLRRWPAMESDPEYQIVLSAARQDLHLMKLLERLTPQDAALAAGSVKRSGSRSGWFKDLLNPKRALRVR